jgi:fumarate reductase subunit D
VTTDAWNCRSHASYGAFLVHRFSGLFLAAFLPFHFWALSQAIQGDAAFDGFLRWADRPLVKLGETLLVAALAVHLAGGLRLLFIEFVGWRDWQKTAVALSAGFGVAAALVFLLNLG